MWIAATPGRQEAQQAPVPRRLVLALPAPVGIPKHPLVVLLAGAPRRGRPAAPGAVPAPGSRRLQSMYAAHAAGPARREAEPDEEGDRDGADGKDKQDLPGAEGEAGRGEALEVPSAQAQQWLDWRWRHPL